MTAEEAVFIRHGQTEALVGTDALVYEHLGPVARQVNERGGSPSMPTSTPSRIGKRRVRRVPL